MAQSKFSLNVSMTGLSICNLYTAASNLWAFESIRYAFSQGKYFESVMLAGTMITSSLYHLADSKDYMVGLYDLVPYQSFLLFADRLLRCFTICYFIFRYFHVIKQIIQKNNYLARTSIIGFLNLILSEVGFFMKSKVSIPEYQVMYVVSRGLWHINFFDSIHNIQVYSLLWDNKN